MKEKLEKLAALWPKDSKWAAKQIAGHDGYLFFDPEGGGYMPHLYFDYDDMDNAECRTIIEDELRRLGYAIVMDSTPNEWVYTASNSEWGPEAGATTRTEALLDVAIAVFEETP